MEITGPASIPDLSINIPEEFITLLKQIDTRILDVPIDIIDPQTTANLAAEILAACPDAKQGLSLLYYLAQENKTSLWLLACFFHYGYAKALYDHQIGQGTSTEITEA